MVKIILKNYSKTFFRYLLFVFLLFSAFFFFISSLLQHELNESKKNELLKSEQRLVDVENKTINNKVNKIISDVLYAGDCLRMYDKGDGDYSEIEKLWLAFSNRKKNYDQIRFIDVDGNEVVRVNYVNNGALLVKKEDLQNKKDRYYFTDTIDLAENQIYISMLDLNVENDVIEEPIKPVLRVSMPYFSQEGKLKGIVILNYAAEDMLEQVKEVASSSNGDIFMLNEEGYWLFDSKNSRNEWSFMYEDKAKVSFANQYSNEWKSIKKNKNGHEISSKGVFVYSNIITNQVFEIANSGYSLVLGAGDWSVVSFLSSKTPNGKLFTENVGLSLIGTVKKNLIWYGLIFILSTIIATLVSLNKIEKERIKHFSEYDTMTGVYNRRAGFEKLTQLYKTMPKNNDMISICFIDINGLKEVNDAFGHESGDELILSVIDGVKKCIRNNDFVARLGGDEFLIIFEGLDEKQAEEIWGRIIEGYALINEIENRKYLISVSHGIETFRCDSNEYIDTIINQADGKMYEEKRRIKKELNVLRDNQKNKG